MMARRGGPAATATAAAAAALLLPLLLLAGGAAGQTLGAKAFNLNMMKGAGASLVPNSAVGVYTPVASPFEFSALKARDRTGFLQTWGFSFENSAPPRPGTVLTFNRDGNFEFEARVNGARVAATGQFVLHVCNSKVKGQALSFGVFADSWGGANAREVLVQSWRQARGGAVYIAAQFFDEADGLPPAAGGKFLAKLDAGASAASALTAQDPRVAGVQCGFAPV